MRQYDVAGMMCAACSARVEKAVSSVPGVTSCAVSLLTNSMGVEGTANDEEIIKAVVDAGYEASVKAEAGSSADTKSDTTTSDPFADKETPRLKKRLILSLIFLLPLLYCTMGHMFWSWPLPAFLITHKVMGLLQLILTTIIIIINNRFFTSGIKSAIHLAPNMDTLVSLGAGVSYIYSIWVLIAGATHDFYFESAAMILTLITVGKMLEARSKGKTTDALRGLMKLAPKTATIIDSTGTEKTVPIEQVKIGDIFVVRPGENIPIDGVITEGNAAINEAAITGESIPVDKTSGDTVSAATTNMSGFIKCRATRVGQDTTLAQIIQLVSDAAATKAPIAKIADKVSGIFVPTVIAISLVTLGIWLAVGAAAETAIMHAVAVLVISCPCALGLATPVAIMVGNGIGARNGILFKTAASLEQAGHTQIIVLDKTGTITNGEPVVTDIIPAPDQSEQTLLQLACSLEKKSEHPLAKAITKKAEEQKIIALETQDFQIFPGNGLKANINGTPCAGGNFNFIKQLANITPAIVAQSDSLATQGKTPLFFTNGNTLLGIISVADTIKPDSKTAVEELKTLGIKVVMLTGDNERTARAIANQAGIENVIAGVLPQQKADAINQLKKDGKTCMVGDGINDAPSLTTADLGVAIGAGSDIAVDAADVVLVKNTLRELPALIRLSRATVRNIHQNLFWAFFYNVIGIPLAAGVFVPLLGWHLNPMFGAAAMSLSSFCVVMNALRLNFKKFLAPEYK